MFETMPYFPDTIDAGQLVFTVEIPKQNKSLGLTISGAEQGSQPIFISEIISGGVAERCGYHHID